MSSFLPQGYALLPPSVFSLTCLVECSTLLFTNGDLYIFLLLAIFLGISLIRSQNILHIHYIKNSFSFFSLLGSDASDIFLGCSMLKIDKSREIIVFQEEMLKCMVGIFKASANPAGRCFFFNQHSDFISDCVG